MKVNQNITRIRTSIRQISELASKEKGCIRLDIGEPSFDTPAEIKEAARKAITKYKSSYAPVRGADFLREKIAEYESKKGLDIAPENVMVTNGGMGALFCSFLGLVGKDEEVVLPDPFWSPYALMLDSLERKHKSVAYYGKNRLDEKKLSEGISPATSMILVNSPNNPAGYMIGEKDMKKIAGIAKEKNITIISDEVYEKITFGKDHVSPARYAPQNTVRINSVSKTFSMIGFRIGWLTAPAEVVDELMKCNRAITASVNLYSQAAAAFALENCESQAAEMVKEYRKRHDIMISRIKETGWRCEGADGAFYLFPDTGKESWSYALELIKEAKVSAVPGAAFGDSGKTSLRLCFGSSTADQINEAFDRIEKHERKQR